jgi:hypothetical protein
VSGASAFIVGDSHRRVWEQRDESLEAFEKRLAKAVPTWQELKGFPYTSGNLPTARERERARLNMASV